MTEHNRATSFAWYVLAVAPLIVVTGSYVIHGFLRWIDAIGAALQHCLQ